MKVCLSVDSLKCTTYSNGSSVDKLSVCTSSSAGNLPMAGVGTGGGFQVQSAAFHGYLRRTRWSCLVSISSIRVWGSTQAWCYLKVGEHGVEMLKMVDVVGKSDF